MECLPVQKPSLMSSVGSKPSSSGKSLCINALKHCATAIRLKQVHGHAIRIGLAQDKDILNKLLAYLCDPCRGNLLYARKLFNATEHRSLISYNLMIRAFAKCGSYSECLIHFIDLRERRLWPDNYTYPFVLKAIGLSGMSRAGEAVHGFCIKSSSVLDRYVSNPLIAMYGELDRINDSKKVFDELPERDVVSWNSLLSGFAKCEKFDRAIDLFYRMRKESYTRPSEATIVSTLSACAALQQTDLGKAIHCCVQKELPLTLRIGNALVDMFCKCGSTSIAHQVFDEIRDKNIITWTTMVSGYCKAGWINKARELFERSPARDVVLYTSMINGYVQSNDLGKAIELFEGMMKDGIEPDKHVVVTILTGCGKNGALGQGKWIHRYIEENGILKNAHVGSALVEMYSKCGCVEEALEAFDSVLEKDTALWTSVICGLSKNGRTEAALKVFSEMVGEGMVPDYITFVGLLSACSHGGMVDEGMRVFEVMTGEFGVEATVEHYSCLVDLLGRAGRLEEALALLANFDFGKGESGVAVHLYGSLLSACRMHGNVKMAETVARLLEDMEWDDSSSHSLLASVYASSDRWQDHTNVRAKMRALRLTKLPAYSSIHLL